MKFSISIRSGGQTGVDRAALDFAVSQGLSYGGWCPHGGWAEDFPTPPGLLTKYPRLSETPAGAPGERTAWNVRDSHATLLIVEGDALNRSHGTILARQAAELVFLRPCLVVRVEDSPAVVRAAEWLGSAFVAYGSSDLLLHVGGPRESELAGIYTKSGEFLGKLLESLTAKAR